MKNLDRYKKENYIVNDNLINNEKDSVGDILKPLLWNVSIYDWEDVYLRDLQEFTLEQKFVFAIHWYNCEVRNGWHEQFYYNSTWIVAQDALDGFKFLWLTQNYEILKESMDRLHSQVSKDRKKRQAQLNSIDPDFSDLDDRFYTINVDSFLLDFIKKNKNKFYFNWFIWVPKK